MPTSAGYERLGVVMTGGNNGVNEKVETTCVPAGRDSRPLGGSLTRIPPEHKTTENARASRGACS
jgi:hypothetical protein